MTALLGSSTRPTQFEAYGPAEQNEINDEEKSPFELLGTQTVMNILGLDADFARRLQRLERAAMSPTSLSASRLCMGSHQQALT